MDEQAIVATVVAAKEPDGTVRLTFAGRLDATTVPEVWSEAFASES